MADFIKIKQRFLLAIFVILATVLVGGCATDNKLSRSIPKGNRIGVVVNMRGQALFHRVGTTAVDNVSFYRRLPSFNINTYVATTMANLLYRSRRYKVIPLYRAPAPYLLGISVQKGKALTPQYRTYLKRVVAGKRLSEVVLVTPADIDFGNGQYEGPIWWVTGYGLFNRAFVFIHTNTVFAGFQVTVIDAKNFQVLGSATSDFQARPHDIDIAWHKGYVGITKSALAVIKQLIRQKSPGALNQAISHLGLI